MGTWGPALYSDDTARDVRAAYRGLVGEGRSGPEATDALLAEWRDALADPDLRPVFWLALADTQWRVGRLEPRVKEQALGVLADGSDLARWSEDPRGQARRAKVLGALAAQLAAPPPAPKRLPRVFRNTCEWEVGELIGYRLRTGRHVVLRVIGHHSDLGGTSPVCEPLDWIGAALPTAGDLQRTKVKAGRHSEQFMLGRLREGELPSQRVTRLGATLPPSQRPGGFRVVLWSTLDAYLEGELGWT